MGARVRQGPELPQIVRLRNEDVVEVAGVGEPLGKPQMYVDQNTNDWRVRCGAARLG